MLRDNEVHVENLTLFYMDKTCDVSSMTAKEFAENFNKIYEEIRKNLSK